MDFEKDEAEEGPQGKANEIQARAPLAPDQPQIPGSGVPVVNPWLAPPDTDAAARIRLSLYFALCVKSRPMLSGLLEAYVTAVAPAQAGLMAELPLLAKATAKGFGEAGVVGLIAAAPDGAQPLVLTMLDLLVPRETNKPSSQLVAAVRRLRDTRVTKAAAAEEGGVKVSGVRRIKDRRWWSLCEFESTYHV